MMNYLCKLTDNNLYYSKIFLEFLFAPSSSNKDYNNLALLLKTSANRKTELFRNLNFITDYKKGFLTEAIKIINAGIPSQAYDEFIVNFAGDVTMLNELAR